MKQWLLNIRQPGKRYTVWEGIRRILLCLVLGILLASWNYMRVAVPIRSWLRSEGAANAVAFILIAIVVAAVTSAIGIFLAKVFQKIGLGCLDSLAGALFGWFQGMLLVTVFLLVTVAFFPETEWLTQSRLPKYFFGVLHVSAAVSPAGLSERVHQELRRLEQESPTWMHPKTR